MNSKNTIFIVCIATTMMIQTPLRPVMPAYSAEEKNGPYPQPHYEKSEPRSYTIHVIEGQTFTIDLASQPSTGYTWYITEPTMEDYVQLLGKTVMPYRCPGGRGKTLFKFQAMRAGRETIRFEYARPWSWDVAQQCIYTIIIREKNVPLYHPKPVFPPFTLPWR